MNSQNGSILLPMSILLIICSLIVLRLFTDLLSYIKVSHHRIDNINEWYQLENISANWRNLIKNDCIEKIDDPNLIIKNLTQNLGCKSSFNNKNFSYFIEDLGVFPCIKIQGNQTYHWRLSVKFNNKIMQTRIAESYPNDDNLLCKAVAYIQSGVLSQRMISN